MGFSSIANESELWRRPHEAVIWSNYVWIGQNEVIGAKLLLLIFSRGLREPSRNPKNTAVKDDQIFIVAIRREQQQIHEIHVIYDAAFLKNRCQQCLLELVYTPCLEVSIQPRSLGKAPIKMIKGGR